MKVLAPVEIQGTRPWADVRAFGAVGNGVADDTAAFLAAIAAVEALNGGQIFVPYGIYLISSTLVCTKAVSFLGVGTSGSNLDAELITAKALTLLKWTGGASPMIRYNGHIKGLSFQNIALDGSVLATIGIQLDRVQQSNFEHIRIANCVTNCLLLTTDATSGSDENTMFNQFTNIHLERCPVPLKFDGTPPWGNVCHNVFSQLVCDFTGDAGIDLVEADNNVFINSFLYRRSGSGYGVYFRAGAYSNTFFHLQPSNGVRVAPPRVAGAGNQIFYYDKANGAPDPTIDTGGKLTWTSDGSNSNGWHLNGSSLHISDLSSPEYLVDIAGDTNNHLRLKYPGSAQDFLSYIRNDRYWVFHKPAGDLSAGANAAFLFEQIGSIDAHNPFYNGLQLFAHTITEGGADRYPILSHYARSASAADPANVEFVSEAAGLVTTPVGITTKVQTLAGNFIRWVLGGAELMRGYWDGTTARLAIGQTTVEGTDKVTINGRLGTSAFRLGTSATAGNVLTTDASGVGAWQAAAGGAFVSIAKWGVD